MGIVKSSLASNEDRLNNLEDEVLPAIQTKLKKIDENEVAIKDIDNATKITKKRLDKVEDEIATNEERTTAKIRKEVEKAKEDIDDYVKTKIDEKIKEISAKFDKKEENTEIEQQPKENSEPTTINEIQKEEEKRTYTDILKEKSRSHEQKKQTTIKNMTGTKTKEDVMKEVSMNVGITGISDEIIRKFSNKTTKIADSSQTVFFSPAYETERNLVVEDFLINIMKYRQQEIRFHNVRMSKKPESTIMWMASDPGFIKNMFIQASKLRDTRINLIPFTPNQAYKRMTGIKKICQNMRQGTGKNIRTQIRPGKDDFEVWIKVMKEGQRTFHVKHTMTQIDPNNDLHDFELEGNDSAEIRGYLDAARRMYLEGNIEENNEEEKKSSEMTEEITLEEQEKEEFQVVERKKRRGSTPKRNEDAKKNKEGSPSHASESTKDTMNEIGLNDEEEDSDELDSE